MPRQFIICLIRKSGARTGWFAQQMRSKDSRWRRALSWFANGKRHVHKEEPAGRHLFTAVQRVSAPVYNTSMDSGVHIMTTSVIFTLEMPTKCILLAFLLQRPPQVAHSTINSTTKSVSLPRLGTVAPTPPADRAPVPPPFQAGSGRVPDHEHGCVHANQMKWTLVSNVLGTGSRNPV